MDRVDPVELWTGGADDGWFIAHKWALVDEVISFLVWVETAKTMQSQIPKMKHKGYNYNHLLLFWAANFWPIESHIWVRFFRIPLFKAPFSKKANRDKLEGPRFWTSSCLYIPYYIPVFEDSVPLDELVYSHKHRGYVPTCWCYHRASPWKAAQRSVIPSP